MKHSISKYLNNKQISRIFFYSISLCLIVYVFFRAYVLSFTHDESYTYLRFVHENFMDIISYKNPFTNNHILNTVLMKYCEELFGNSELILRMPNILSCILFIFYSYKIFCKKTPLLYLPFFIMITFNPYLLDFFSLARGYGLSFAFMLMSLYHLLNYFDSNHKKDIILFNAAALLASLSNFSLLNYYLIALFVYNLIQYAKSLHELENKSSFKFFKLNKINFLFIGISAAILYEPLRRLSKGNLLDFGGKEGFITDTVGSVVKGLFYDRTISETTNDLIALACTFVTLSIFITILFKFIRKDSTFINKYIPLITINLILILVSLSSIVQHIVFKTDFYTGRFALFFYPLFILNLAFYLDYLYNCGLKKTILIISTLTPTFLIINLLTNLNTSHCKDWMYDMHTKSVMQKITSLHDKNNLKKTRLEINWLFEPSTNFYRYTKNLNWLYPTHRDGLKPFANFYYVFNGDTSQILKNTTVIVNFTQNQTQLLTQ